MRDALSAQSMSRDARRGRSALIALWALFGVSALLVHALVRLTPLALEPIQDGSLSAFQIVVYVLWVLLNGYAEGYRGFHLRFSPRTVDRAFRLGHHPPKPAYVLLAPLFAMGLFHATRRVLITSWSIVLGVTGLVLLVHQLDQPWRGIIDGGVVVGLALGLLSLLNIFIRALLNPTWDIPTQPSMPNEQ